MPNSQPLRKALERHRDSGSGALQLEIPMANLVDESRCQVLTEDLRQASPGSGWEVHKVKPNLDQQLPDEIGLYMFVWRTFLRLPIDSVNQAVTQPGGVDLQRLSFVLYVGKAGGGGGNNTLRKRYKSEYKRLTATSPDLLWETAPMRDRKDRLTRFLNLEELEYWFLTIDDHGAVEDLESRLIRMLNPPLNNQGLPTLRKSEFKPAF